MAKLSEALNSFLDDVDIMDKLQRRKFSKSYAEIATQGIIMRRIFTLIRPK